MYTKFEVRDDLSKNLFWDDFSRKFVEGDDFSGGMKSSPCSLGKISPGDDFSRGQFLPTPTVTVANTDDNRICTSFEFEIRHNSIH